MIFGNLDTCKSTWFELWLVYNNCYFVIICDSIIQHEGASVMMFEHLLKVNNLREELEKYGLGETDIVFIKEQIAGPRQSEMSSQLSEVSDVVRGLV